METKKATNKAKVNKFKNYQQMFQVKYFKNKKIIIRAKIKLNEN